jgi:hypothetical protein
MSSKRVGPGITGLVALGLLAAGCRPKPAGDAPAPPPPTLTAADAGAAAAADAAAPVDTTFRVVAQSPEPVRFFPQPDGRLLVGAGGLLYDAKPDGTLTLALPLEAFTPTMPADEIMVGYGEGTAGNVVFAATDKEGLVAQWDHATFRVTNAKLVPMDGAKLVAGVAWRGRIVGPQRADSRLAWLTGTEAVPSLQASDVAVDRKGGLAVISHFGAGGLAYVAEPTDNPTTTKVPDADRAHCRILHAADKEVYVVCTTWDRQKRKSARYRLEAGAWKPAFVGAPEGEASVAADGALWVASGLEMQRCAPNAACTRAAMDPLELEPKTPWYSQTTDEALVDSTFKRYQSFVITTPQPLRERAVDAILARSDGDVWAAVRIDGSYAVVHTGTAARSRTMLPSEADARVLVRNTKPPTPWVGHCDQIFLRVGAGKDADALGKRKADIEATLAAVKTDSDYGISWAIVRGRLHDKDSAGVVLWRHDLETSQAYLERVATKLTDKLAKDPVDRPVAYCTLPVLTSVVVKP